MRSGAGYSPDQAGLLTIRHAISNFDIYKRRAQCEGWSEKPGAKVCNWAGVSCVNGQVTGLHFLNNGSVLVGARTGPCHVARPRLLGRLLLLAGMSVVHAGMWHALQVA